ERATARAVEDRIGNEGDGFDRRMQTQKDAFLGLAPEASDPGIGPDIGAVAAMAAERDIVVMRRLAILEHGDEFVLRTVGEPMPPFVLTQTQRLRSLP